jgi:SAM-dependent methyltransferase
MDLDDLVRDTLPVNQPYDGLLAEAYDVWLPPDGNYGDVDDFRCAIEGGNGPALELGCGNGRLLLGFVGGGLDVEGVDASADMLGICAAHAADAGIDVTLHQADWTTLDLGKQYATVYNPAGSFALIDTDDDARVALVAWHRHLRPGGRLLISMGVPTGPDLDANYEWRIRRCGTRPRDGMTFIVHEAFRYDTTAQVQHVLNRHEVWDAGGALVSTFLRRMQIRWWTRPQMEALLRDCDFVDVQTEGSGDGFVTVGRAP